MKVFKENLCFVCGFDFYKEFGFKPWTGESPSDEICPSCGFQFGLNDYDDKNGYKNKENKYAEWRKKWIDGGMKWNKGIKNSPKNWNPNQQLKQLGL